MSKSLYQELRRQDKLHGTITRAAELREKRDDNPFEEVSVTRMHPVAIELGPEHREDATCEARAQYPARQNWDEAAPSTCLQQTTVTVETVNHGQYSRRCRYQRLSYRPEVRSCGICTRKRVVLWFGQRKYKRNAPKGWRFGTDYHGIYLTRTKETRKPFRYHPDSGEWSAGIAAIRNAAIEHERNRIATAKFERQKKRIERTLEVQRVRAERLAEQFGPVLVCAKDSRRAGNCLSGTTRFARDNGLAIRSHVPIAVLERISESGRGRYGLRRAINFAQNRAVEEFMQGFSRLEDHVIQPKESRAIPREDD